MRIWTGIDGGYGKEPAFLHGVDGLNCRFVADVHCDQTIYPEDPDPKVPAWKGRGKRPERLQAQCDALRVDAWAAGQPAEAWQRHTLRDGEKGYLTAEYLHTLVWVWDGTEENARRWHLPVRREVGAKEVSHDCLSNAPLETSLDELARVQACRVTLSSKVFGKRKGQVRNGRLPSPSLGCLASSQAALVMLAVPCFWPNKKCTGANSGPCCNATIW
ncbi:MAG: transposase [Methylocella sp.]